MLGPGLEGLKAKTLALALKPTALAWALALQSEALIALGLGLATQGPRPCLVIELETYPLLHNMQLSSTVVCKFSAENNKLLHNGSYAQK